MPRCRSTAGNATRPSAIAHVPATHCRQPLKERAQLLVAAVRHAAEGEVVVEDRGGTTPGWNRGHAHGWHADAGAHQRAERSRHRIFSGQDALGPNVAEPDSLSDATQRGVRVL